MSASRAIEPDAATMTTCSSAVAPIPARPTQAARMPVALASWAVWIASVWSCACGRSACRSRSPDRVRAVASRVVPVPVAVPVAVLVVLVLGAHGATIPCRLR